MTELLNGVLPPLESFILLYFLAVNSFYAVLLLQAARELNFHRARVRSEHRHRLSSTRVAPRISILAPAFNEEKNVVDSVRALLAHSYPDLEVVVINDGSTDATLERLIQAFHMQPIEAGLEPSIPTKALHRVYFSRQFPNLVVLDKANGGKSDSLNLGLQLARGTLICAIDADTLIHPDALARMVRPFLDSRDVVAAGGTLRVVNGCQVEGARVVSVAPPRTLLAGCQTSEYVRAFMSGRLGLNRLGGNLIVSGAFGLFERQAMLDVGGYALGTVGEDMELVVRLRRRGYEQGGPHRVVQVPDPVAWTEAPSSWRVLDRQRDRWQRGLCDTLWRHRGVCLNPRYGLMGLLVYPYLLLAELLSPVVEALGWGVLVLCWGLGRLDVSFAVGFLALALGYSAMLSCFAMVLEEECFPGRFNAADRLRFVLYGLLENLGYRQFIVVSRLKGILKFLLRRQDWGRMERQGFKKEERTS